MKPEELKILQNTELKILTAVAAFCEKHGLRYFLDSGTLIGAIRHDGFIPWDDDIDISMPCEDYYRFLEIAPAELGEDFFILNHETSDHFFNSYTKVCLKGTTVLPVNWKFWDIPHCAWIDIFPMFYADNDREIRRKKRIYQFCSLLQKKNYYKNCMLVDNYKTTKNVIAYTFHCAMGIIPVKVRKKLHSRLLNRIWARKDGRYLCRCAIIIRKFEKGSYMGPKRYHKFEQFSFRIPNDFDKVLRTEYGDYMQMPPEDKRGGHGKIEISL